MPDATKVASKLKDNTQTAGVALKRRSNKAVSRVKKHHHIAIHTVLFVFVASLLFASNQVTTERAASSQAFSFGYGGSAPATIDEISSANVAAQIAEGANLIIADNVQNLADSLSAQVNFATTDNSYLNKPQIVATDAKTRQDVTSYVVKEGEELGDIARRFNVTTDTIRWANDLIGTAISTGQELTIPPVSGVLHTVGEGETAESIAQQYEANVQQIVAFNDAEVNGLPVGERIVVPNGQEPAPVEPTYFSSGSGFAFGTQPLYGGNGYSYGYCTWHVANRRAAIGNPIPRNLGNAVTWASVASRSGLQVGAEPRAGAVLWHKNTYIAGGFGHVAFVESINADGSAVISEMNYQGWNVISNRTITAEEFASYLFIY